MSKAVLMSIQPKWCELIASGKKTIEVRKTHPKLETPFKVYIYCTQGDNSKALLVGTNQAKIVTCTNYKSAISVGGYIGNGKVIGEFICNKFNDLRNMSGSEFFPKSCMTYDDWRNYTDYTNHIIWAWYISNLVIYDKPKELSEFIRICPEWEKEKITNKCLKCAHHFISNADCFAGCDCEGELSITRPPQSWCYVEELSE